MQEVLFEFIVRFAKLVVAAILGALIYWVLTGPAGVPGSPQLALESWIAGALVILLLETGIV